MITCFKQNQRLCYVKARKIIRPVLELYVAAMLLFIPSTALGANKYWSGTKTWDAGTANWSSTTGGGAGPYTNATFVTNDAAIFEGTAGTVTISAPNNPNSLTFNITGYTLSSGTLTLNGASINTNGYNATIGSVVSGSVGLTKAGTGTLTLSGTNNYTGTTTINGGILKAGSSQPFGNTSNNITVNSGGSLDANVQNLQGYTNSITINGSGVSTDVGTLTNSGADALTAYRSISLGSDASIGGNNGRFDFGRNIGGTVITGNSHVLTKVGSNMVGILGQSTGLTGFVINNGTIQFEDNSAFGTAPVTINSSGTLTGWGGRTISNNLTISSGTLSTINGFDDTYSGNVTLTGTPTVYTSSGNITMSGTISSTGSLTKTGAQTLTLTGPNTYSGNTKISVGTLKTGATNTLPSATVITIGNNDANNAVLDLNGYNQTIGGLVEGGSSGGTKGITNNGSGQATLTVNNSSDYSLSYVVANGSNTLNLTKNGAGKLTLSGINIVHTGVNTISNGTLAFSDATSLANGSSKASFSIASGAVLEFYVSGSQLIGSNDASGTVISGTGTLRKTGPGALNLGGQGSNTYKVYFNMTGGTIDIQAGTLLNGGWAGGQWTNNKADMNIASGARFDIWDGNTVYVDALTGAGTLDKGQTDGTTRTMIVGVNDGSGTFSGNITQSAGASYPMAFTKNGSGTQILTGTNTYTGATTVNGGILKAGSAQPFGAFSDNITVNSGAAIDVNAQDLRGYTNNIVINGSGVSTDVGALTNSGADDMNALRSIALGSDASIGGNNGRLDIGRSYWGQTVITGNNHTLTKVGSNLTAILAQSTGLTGIVINNGTISAEDNNALGTAPVTVNSAGTLIIYGGRKIANNITMNSGTLAETYNFNDTCTGSFTITGTSVFNSSGNTITISGIISSTGGLSKTGNQTLVLTGANTYTGTTTINAGTLVVGSGGSLYSGGTYAGSVVINNGGTFSINNAYFWGAYTTFPSPTVTISAGGTMSINGYSTTLGPLNLNGGTLLSNGGDPTAKTGSLHGTVTVGGSAKSNISDQNATSNNAYKVGNNTVGGTTTFNVGDVVAGVDLEVSTQLRDDRDGGMAQVASGIIKTGAGTMVLSADNGYTGTTTISAGTLQIGNGGTIGSVAGNITDNATLVFNRSDNITFSNTLSGSGAVTQSGSGTVTLSGANITYTGATTVNSGTLVLQNLSSSTSFTIASGATLEYNTSSDILNTTNTSFSGTGTLKKTGAGQLIWSTGAATFALSSGGLIDVEGGIFKGGSCANEVWTNNYSDLTVASGATFTGVEANVRVDALSGAGTISSGYSGSGYTNFTFGVDNGSGTFSGALANEPSQVGNYVKAGNGNQILSGTNTYTGTTTVNAGSLTINGSLSSSSAVTVASGATLAGTGNVAGPVTIQNGGILQPGNGSAAKLRTGALTLNGTSVLNWDIGTTSDTVAVTGNLALNGTINVTDAGGLTLGQYTIMTYSGTLSGSGLTIGTVPYGFTASISTATANKIILTIGATNYTWDNSTSAGIQTGDGIWGTNNYWTPCGHGGILFAWPGAGNSATFAGSDGTYTITVNGTQNVDSIAFVNSGYTLSGGTLNLGSKNGINVESAIGSISSVISGSNGIIKYGPGQLNLSGNNTFTGASTVSSGKLALYSANALGATSGATTVSNGAAIILNGSPITFAAEPLYINGNGVTVTGALRTSNAGSADTVIWPGNVTLQSNSSIGAPNAVDQLTITGVIAGAYQLTTDGSGTIILTGTNTYSGGTVNTGNLQIGNGGTSGSIIGNITDNASIIFNRSDAVTFGGIISGSGTITQAGSGKLTLSGANTYTGTTTVSSGNLCITGSISGSATTVSSGATLSGTGATGLVTVQNGGILQPGDNSAAKLSTGTLILNNTSVLNWDIGTTSDTVAVTGNITLCGVINITAGSGFNAGTYTIMTSTGTITNTGVLVNTIPNGYSAIVSVSGSSVRLIIDNEKLLPVTVVQAAPRCSVYTNNWTLVFDNGAGGGINVLTDSIHGLSHGQGNQIGGSQNLYYIYYDGSNSKTNGNGTWSVLTTGTFYTTIRQSGTIASLPYTTDYTIHGSGKMFVKTTIINSGGSDVTGKTIRCVSERRAVTNMSASTGNASANLSPYVLLSSDSLKQNDILLSTKDLWNTSSGAPNSATGFYSNAASGYTGYEGTNITIPAGQRQSWEYMVDFSHSGWNDTSWVGQYSDDYRTPDSLTFISGTPAMEQDWERYIYGHWKLDETGSCDTARDFSGNNRHGSATGTWTTGKLGGGLQLNGSQKVTVANNSVFLGPSHFTAMAWVKLSGNLSSSTVVMGKHDGSNGWKLTGDASQRLCLTLNGTAVSAKTAVSTGTWHHVAVSWSRITDTIVFFLDGRVDKTVKGAPTITTNAANLLIGDGINGIIDDARYYGDPVSENTLKSIYQNGYRSSEGFYMVRASNDNAIQIKIDGGTIPRRFPVFQIANYWATSKPAAGCVVLDGVALTEGTDYYADLNDQYNNLTIGFNKSIRADSVRIYVDDKNPNGAKAVTPTPKMNWGIAKVGTVDYFWAKNFSGNTFGNSTSNQWFMNWKMISSTYSRAGEINFLASSVTNPSSVLDTNSNTNLIPPDAGYYSTFGQYCFDMSSQLLRSSQHSGTFTYAVEESTSTRIVLRINDRTVTNGGQTFHIVTRYTVYPSGQIFKWDSLSQFSSVPGGVWSAVHLRYSTNGSLYKNGIKKRCGIIYTSGYPDLASAWLSFKNASGYQAQPFDSDTLGQINDANRYGYDFEDASLPAVWNSANIQTALYIDLQHSTMNNAFIDSVSNGVQYIGIKGGEALSMISGTLDKSTAGDLNGDGFNESEGAYIVKADNNNIVHFKLPAYKDTCRFYPAFRVTAYTASTKPQYVYVYRGTDTACLVENYQYNIYHDKTNRQLILQIDSIFRDTVGIFISSDRTLAVKLSSFTAKGGMKSDTLRWQTESEQDNYGFYIYRRVKPSFIDSIELAFKNVSETEKSSGQAGLYKRGYLKSNDSVWVLVNKDIIPGAPQGASYGTRMYEMIDKDVFVNVPYEYKLVSVDYSNKQEEFGPVLAIPGELRPLEFTLWNNYPNPFRQATVIKFALPQNCRMTLDIYNIQGRLIKHLVRPDKVNPAGFHQVVWDGTNELGRPVSAGPYMYRFVTGRFVKSKMMLYLK
jgi:autotransporter-associated beta strand protein